MSLAILVFLNMLYRLFHSLYLYVISLFFCLRYLPLKVAVKVPIYISPHVRIGKLKKNSIIFDCEPKRSMIVIGFNGTEGMNTQTSFISVNKDGKIIFNGYAIISRGVNIIADGGIISFGNHFFCNNNCRFWSNTKIIIGDDNMYGWSINFNTSNGHLIYENGVQKPMTGNIAIGNHVWICSYCNISKNIFIADGCVVSQNSLVVKKHYNKDTLIGGNPARDLKHNIEWKK